MLSVLLQFVTLLFGTRDVNTYYVSLTLVVCALCFVNPAQFQGMGGQGFITGIHTAK